MSRARNPLIFGFLASFAVNALADEPPRDRVNAKAEAKAASSEGQRLYENGVRLADKSAKMALYAAAHEKFRRAYELDPKPDYLFNIAQTARFKNDCPTALGAYKRVAELVGERDEARRDASGDKKTAEMQRIVTSWIERLEDKCEASDEFVASNGNSDETSSDNTSGDNTSGDNTSAGGNASSDGTSSGGVQTNTSGGLPAGGDERPRRSAWVGATIGLSVVAVALGGYAGFEAIRLRSGGHYDGAFGEAAAIEGFVPAGPGNPCDDPFLGPMTQRACDDGDAAASRANLALGGAVVFGVAAIVTGYLAFRRPATSAGKETVITSGPGEFGVAVMTRF